MHTLRVLAAAVVLCALAAPPVNAAVQQSTLDEAKSLLQAGNAEQAYDLLIPLEAEHAGEPAYDYLLGLAALDSGHTTRAVFALERVLAVQPDHQQARAELARAYFELGETARARAQFEEVQREGVPAAVSETIDRYLSAIHEGAMASRKRYRAWASLSFGYDSNVNSATGDTSVAVPALGGLVVNLLPSGVEEDDVFGELGGGFSVRYPVGVDVDAIAGASALFKENNTESDFATGTIGGHLGFTVNNGPDRYTAALQAENFQVGHDTFRNALGGLLQWSRALTLTSQGSAYIQVTRLKYPDQSIRDATRYVTGVGYSRVFPGRYRPSAYLGLYGGTEDEIHAGVPWLGHDFVGVRTGGQIYLSDRTAVYGSADFEYKNYGGTEPLFLKGRDDRRLELSAGVHFVPAPKWRITPHIDYTRNDSNISIFEFDRVMAAVTVRRVFE